MSVVTESGIDLPTGADGGPTTGEREVLAPYLPRLVVDWIASIPERRHLVIDGTVAFVDISGFTKLSEGLARHGKIGAEELAATIGDCFVQLLDIAYENGGRLLKFGGDALLLLFSGVGHQSRACRAAFEMRQKLAVVGRLTVLGQKVTLRMSVGVHSGRFDMFLVGDSHRELVVTGPAASTTVSMEARRRSRRDPRERADGRGPPLFGARVGEERRSALAPCPGDRLGVGHSAGPRRHPGGPLPVHPASPSWTPCSAPSHEPEHRRVTVSFLHFDGTDAILETSGAETSPTISTSSSPTCNELSTGRG